MGEASLIGWTDHTFNPWIGCSKVSPGCTGCYAERLTRDRMGLRGVWGPTGERVVTSDENWRKPARWNRQAATADVRRRVFCASLGDVFEEQPVADATRPRLWELIRETPHLDWSILTKRPEHIAAKLPKDWGQGWPNVWLGASVEDQRRAEQRIPELLRVPAVVHFLSVEPLLEPVTVGRYLGPNEITWVIVGGESGPRFRPMDHAWARALRDECREAGVAFFFKQSAAYRTELGKELIEKDGTKSVIREYPTPEAHRREESLSGSRFPNGTTT